MLGVTFDPMFTFNKHIANTARKANARINVLRALSDTSFGQDKECLVLTYKEIVRPFFDYAAPIVYPNLSPSSFKVLQKIQNKALRLITGTHSASAIDFLHQEVALLPVEDHMKLLAAQFLARALQPAHPSYETVSLAPQPNHRQMKHTLRSKCFPIVEPYLQDGIIPASSYKETISKIHTDIVSDTVDAQGPNRVLNGRPPLINPNEAYLPRQTRAVLARLRSGFCSDLKDYQLRLGRSDDDLCPECRLNPASSSHIFSCPSHPTNLTTTDLWEKPWEVAQLLASFQAFDNLPPPGPPPPPRPRRRRRPPPEPPP